MQYISKLVTIFKKRKKPFKYLLGRFLMYTKLCLLFSIKRKYYKLRFYPSSLSLTIWLYPNERIDEYIFFNNYLKPSDNVVDVGANIGTITLLASFLITDAGQVFSIEANPKTFEYLEGNVAFNKKTNINLFNIGLGDTKGEMMFADIFGDDTQYQIVTKGTGIKIPITTLDELKINNEKIHLLKIDTEGFEIFVLKGGVELLKRTDCIYMESCESHFINYNYSTRDVLGFLFNQGFRCYRFTDLLTLSEISNNYTSSSNENIVAVKDINSFIQRTNYKLLNYNRL